MAASFVTIAPISLSDRNILIELLKKYYQEFLRLSAGNVGIELNKFLALTDTYWQQENRFPYFIFNKGAVVGFVLVNDYCEVEQRLPKYSIAEFYVLPAYRKNNFGIGAFLEVVEMHPAYWEIRIHSYNTAALQFWRKVVERYTNDFTETTDTAGKSIIQFCNLV